MRLTIAYSKIKKRNLVLINNATYQRETLSERPIRQPLSDDLNEEVRITPLNWILLNRSGHQLFDKKGKKCNLVDIQN